MFWESEESERSGSALRAQVQPVRSHCQPELRNVFVLRGAWTVSADALTADICSRP